jgi:endogenous inhibitor of DNA gyrase (YacG/DUF329 family)
MSTRPLCVYCREREVEIRYRPFCSERCKLADLGRWLGGDYRIPDEPADTADLGQADLDDEASDPDR